MAQNVVLLCMDSVRFGYFDRYAGNLKAVTDLSFEECRTASTWSVPSHASLFTGVLPNEHGFHSATPAFEALDREQTFLGALDGYRAVGVSANPYASPIFGFDALFDEFYHIEPSKPSAGGLSPAEFWHESTREDWTRYLEFLRACALHDHPVQSLANGVASQIEGLFERLPLAKPFDDGCRRILSQTRRVLDESDRPTFVFANIMDAHGPLTNVRGYDQSLIPAEHRHGSPDIDALAMNLDDTFDDHEAAIATYQALYAAAVEYTTRQVADFVQGVDEETAVVITSDHGEQLADGPGERRFGHVTPDMSEALLHVPLVLVNANQSVDEAAPISHLDLGALVTAIATGADFEHRAPLAAEVAGLGVAHPPTAHEDFDYWNRVSRCVYLEDGSEKYVWSSRGDARRYARADGEYVLEREGGFELLPDAATRPFSTAIEAVDPDGGARAVDAAVASRLEELGYR